MHTLTSLRAGELAGSKRLDLRCSLTEFPPEIFALADSLEILNLSGNALSSLPDDLWRLTRLRVIFCSENKFTVLPAVLGQCPQLTMIGFKSNQIRTVPAAALPPKLRWLILTDNQISILPPQLGDCSELQKLMLAGNQLQQLPLEMAACTQLELVRISANQFEQLPDWLLALPKLAWLAYGGNPCSDRYELAAAAQPAITKIAWHRLQLEEKLGEGASGVIYQAKLDARDAVAVKLFKGALTSDGLSRSEKAAYIAAGRHPLLIPLLGEISDHPQHTPALAMQLINPSFTNLAGPPSLESCTRDCYAPQQRYSPQAALAIALGIAAVAEHLHTQGLMHGDLYAHNIMWNQRRDCLLADFGAATFLPQHDTLASATLQRLEVRAFASLLQELLERIEPQPGAAQEVLAAIQTLYSRCAHPEVSSRPLFKEISASLIALNTTMRPLATTI
jgi:hypothetical protein